MGDIDDINEHLRLQLMMAIDYLERSQLQEYSIKGYESTAEYIKQLNKKLKSLERNPSRKGK